MVLRASLEKKEEKIKVRVALMRAAVRLAAAHGFAGLGLREVAREAGIAPTSFYRHFADMEELGMALIRELAGRALRELGERALAVPNASVLPAIAQAMFGAIAQDPELMRFVIAERTGASPSFRALLRGELAVLARTLYSAWSGETTAASSPPPTAAESAVSLLIDAAAAALDEPEARRAALEEPLVWSMTALLSAAPGSRRGAQP
jgi:AcrR family transcriptional regulator